MVKEDDPALGRALVASMGPVIVINLLYRTDRLREVTHELAKIGLAFDGIAVHRFDAIRPAEASGFATIGARGCFMSHLGVLETAVEKGWDGVVIVEDDMDFVSGVDARLRLVVDRLARVDWGIFHGGPNHQVKGSVIDADAGLLVAEPDAGIMLTHFIAFRGPVVRMARDYLRAILTRQPGDPAGGPMDVDGAYSHFRADNRDVVTIVACPPLAIQRPSFADVRDRKWFDKIGVLSPLLRLVRRFKREVKRRI